MGSRGSFISVDHGVFIFRKDGQIYRVKKVIDNVKVLEQAKGSIKIPDYSHSPFAIYAIEQNGKLKQVAFYMNHKKYIDIHLMHRHEGLMPHKHYYEKHEDKGIKLSNAEIKLIEKIKKGLGI